MSEVFLTADTHFGHDLILKLENRPFADTEIMDKELISNWNSVVTPKDTVFHLGDVSFRNKERTTEIISNLNGKKILICGNHDLSRSNKWWMDVGFSEVYRYPIVYRDFFIFSHKPPEYYNAATAYFYAFGHVHGSEMYRTISKQTSCVCTERWGFTPVNFEKILELSKLIN